jgi:hypothetical protein
MQKSFNKNHNTFVRHLNFFFLNLKKIIKSLFFFQFDFQLLINLKKTHTLSANKLDNLCNI